MKKVCALILTVLFSLQLCGCQKLPAKPVDLEQEAVELTLAIPKNSSSILREVAQELARRAEDFTGNSLTVNIVEKDNIWDAAERGSVDLLVCENSRLLKTAEKSGELIYPDLPEPSEETTGVAGETAYLPLSDIEGGAAMLAMLEYPYFFREGECVLGGANDPQFLAALNHSLPEDMAMELKRISYSGCYHWLTGDHETLELYLSDKSSRDVLRAQITGESLRDPFGYLGDSEVYVREVDLSDSKADLSDKTLLLSGARQKLVDIFVLPESISALNEEQQAAIEEAIVYSGGYSRTLADDQQNMILEQMADAGIDILEINIDQWYEAFQELYRSGDYELNKELVELLRDKTESYH